MSETQLTLKDAQASLEELRVLAKEEYGVKLEDLFFSREEEDRMRLVRLAGILAKRPFATPVECDNYSGNYGASRAWIWDSDKLNDPEIQKSSEFQFLEQVRVESNLGEEELINIAQEAGLMYVIGKWLHGIRVAFQFSVEVGDATH